MKRDPSLDRAWLGHAIILRMQHGVIERRQAFEAWVCSPSLPLGTVWLKVGAFEENLRLVGKRYEPNGVFRGHCIESYSLPVEAVEVG